MNLAELLDAMSAQRAANEAKITKKMAEMPLIDWNTDFDIEILKKEAGRKWRVIFDNLEILLKRCLKTQNTSYFELSVYDSELMGKFFGARMTIQRTIQHACKLGFLACVDGSYRFGADNKKFNQSKKYALNEKMAKQFIANVCYSKSIKNEADHNTDNNTDNGGTGLSINVGNDTLYHTFADDENSVDLTYYVTHSNHVFKLRGIKMGDDTEAQVESFYRDYPFLPMMQDEAEELNRTYYGAFEQLKSRWIPTISDKGVGFRATSRACQTRKGEERERVIFEPYFGQRDEVYHFDVKSSIYQINHALRFGRWAGNDVDFYKKIAGCQLSPEQRDSMKILCQQVYFCEDESRLGANIMWRAGLCRIADAAELKNIALELKKRMIEAIGEPVGKHVFVFESCVYHRLLKQLLSEGFKIAQVYDCFYSDSRAAIERAESILPQIAESTLREIGAIESKPLTMNENQMNENELNINDTDTVNIFGETRATTTETPVIDLSQGSRCFGKPQSTNMSYEDVDLPFEVPVNESAKEEKKEDDLEDIIANMSWREIESLGQPKDAKTRSGADVLTASDYEEVVSMSYDDMPKAPTPVKETTPVKKETSPTEYRDMMADVIDEIASIADNSKSSYEIDDDALSAIIEAAGIEAGSTRTTFSRYKQTDWSKIDVSKIDSKKAERTI